VDLGSEFLVQEIFSSAPGTDGCSWGLNSGLNFDVSFLDSFNGRRQLLPQHLAL
jgi:hypothetical protein